MKRQKLKLLVVTAHLHDFTHCSGTCGIHISMGDEVTVATMTDGAYTHNEKLHDELIKPKAEQDISIINQTPEEYAEIKARELRQACGLFGVTDVRIMDFPQPFSVIKYPESVQKLTEIIHEVRPNVLITQKPYLDGPNGMASGERDDHTETAFAVLDARKLAEMPMYGSRQRPHKIAATYYMGIYFQRDQVDFVVDISDWLEQRVQAEALFKSQGHTDTYARRRVEVSVGNTGWYSGTGYAEAFVRERFEVLPSIVVPESALTMAKESHKTRVDRLVEKFEKNL